MKVTIDNEDLIHELWHMYDMWKDEWGINVEVWLEDHLEDNPNLTPDDYYRKDAAYDEIEVLCSKGNADLSEAAIKEILEEMDWWEHISDLAEDKEFRKACDKFKKDVGALKPKPKRVVKRGDFNHVYSLWKDITKEVGEPPVDLISQAEFKRVTGYSLGYFHGRCSPKHAVIAVLLNRSDKELINTLWHELAHYLFPSKPHWWVECYAGVMSGSNHIGRWASRYGKSIEDVPSRDTLLKLSILASHRKNAQ